MEHILEVKNLSKKFGKFGLDNIHFSLKENCITGFIGINGAGKTTTIKSILGQILKDSGTIEVFGKDIDLNEREIKNRIGVVLDEGYFYESMTLKEMKNVIAPSYSNWNEQTFNSYIKRFNLNLNHQIYKLSKGMNMKFAIALALSHNADLLIMDEPTSGLDPLVRSELMDILLEFMKNPGKSVFFSTHITSDLEKVADRLILIDKGKIILDEDKSTIMDNHKLVKCKKNLVNSNMKNMFFKYHESEDNFEGITYNATFLENKIKDIHIQDLSIEEIMLAYIGRG